MADYSIEQWIPGATVNENGSVTVKFPEQSGELGDIRLFLHRLNRGLHKKYEQLEETTDEFRMSYNPNLVATITPEGEKGFALNHSYSVTIGGIDPTIGA